MKQQIDVLEFFAQKLNQKNIRWGLGGSFLLYYKNITNVVNDIDILIHEKDFDKLLLVLKDFSYKYNDSSGIYSTLHYFSLTVKGVTLDLMLGFKVKTKSSTYVFPFNEDALEKVITKNNVVIYLSSIKEWGKAYKAMNRLDKIRLLDDYFSTSNV